MTYDEWVQEAIIDWVQPIAPSGQWEPVSMERVVT